LRRRLTLQMARYIRYHSLYLAITLLWLMGCADALSPPGQNVSVQSDSPKENVARPAAADPAWSVQRTDADTNRSRLAVLWRTRREDLAVADYPIGPGDVLNINVAGTDELTNRVVRVTGDGLIVLPLVGTLQAAGLTEESLGQEIRTKLAQYVKQPQVTIFVQEYRSRQVGVFGAVAKPGVYSLASGKDTLSDMISLAGGATPDAASRIDFVPANPAAKGRTPAGVTPPTPPQVIIPGSVSRATNTISIDLNDSSSRTFLALPARPGDILVVPPSGEVLVEGWVSKPGSYKVTPGLRVLGAIAAAGGPLYPADTNAVVIIRNAADGQSTQLSLDLDKIKRGESQDPPVREADVVEVGSSTAKLVPYAMYQALTQIIHLGAYSPIF
jgi:polysaccharide export outer membrane protein